MPADITDFWCGALAEITGRDRERVRKAAEFLAANGFTDIEVGRLQSMSPSFAYCLRISVRT